MQSHRPNTLIIRQNQHGCLHVAYFVIATIGLSIGIALAIRDGGASISLTRNVATHRTGTWVPMPYVIPVTLFLASPFFVLPAYGIAVSRRAKITMNSVGIIETDSKGKEILRAKWEEVVEVSQNKGTKVNIVTVRGVARIDKRHRRFAAAMAMVKEHTGKALS